MQQTAQLQLGGGHDGALQCTQRQNFGLVSRKFSAFHQPWVVQHSAVVVTGQADKTLPHFLLTHHTPFVFISQTFLALITVDAVLC